MVDTIWICLFMVVVHWIADFVLQTGHMAERKSTSNYYLTLHITAYSFATIICWFIGFYFIDVPMSVKTMSLSFSLIFTLHWFTDYITSRKTSKLWKESRVHDFFVMVGFDQVLHYFQLFLIYKYIILS